MGEAGISEEEWWARWRERDYSWANLKKHEIAGLNPGLPGSSNTLYSYWRKLSGDLDEEAAFEGKSDILIRDPDNRLWHIIHAPTHWPNLEPTPKANPNDPIWKKIDELVAKALAAMDAPKGGWSTEEERHYWRVDGVDRRAQLQGAVLRGLKPPTVKPLAIVANDCAFLETLQLNRVELATGAGFEDAAFFNGANFNDCKFLGTATFYGAVFWDAARFHRSSFAEGVYFGKIDVHGSADFTNAPFRHEADFTGAHFRGEADFRNGGFTGTATFKQCVFDQTAKLNQQSFAGNVNFDLAAFHGCMTFASTRFGAFTQFTELIWPLKAADWHSAFDQATFEANVSFARSELAHFAAFDGARFEGSLKLDAVEESRADKQFQSEYDAAIELATRDSSAAEGSEEDIAAAQRKALNQRLGELEQGCRVLKDAFGKAQNRRGEQRLHRYELVARRAQPATPPLERWFSHLYAWTANYGESILLPIGTLAAVWLGFAAIYWVIDGFVKGVLLERLTPSFCRAFDPNIISSIGFSASRVFPFGFWTRPEGQAWAVSISSNEFWALVVRLLATLESAIALGLLFLFGLALRRKFQIT